MHTNNECEERCTTLSLTNSILSKVPSWKLVSMWRKGSEKILHLDLVFLEKENTSEEKRAADIAAVEQLAQQEGEGEELMPRKHPSDDSGDIKSLDRAGTRNLYLLLQTVENGKEVWRFPQGDLGKGQFLHRAALTDLYAECGDKMDTWVVGKAPIGVYQPPQTSASSQETPEHYVFFYKAHILAGQVHPIKEYIKNFAWLTKEEIKPRVDESYWEGIKNILSDH